MPSDLKQKVKIAINNFVASRTSNDHGDIAIDVLRVIRDEAALLMERQTIVDAFDSDALKFYDGDESLKIQVERIKKLLHVIDCSRCVTMDGNSSIDAVVEIVKDSKMKNVNHSIRLTFKYRREAVPMEYNEMQEATASQSDSPIATENNNNHKHNKNPTHVTYDIEYSKDYGKKKRLLTVEVRAENNYPSAKQAIPMDDENSVENDEEFDLIQDEVTNNIMEESKIQDSMSVVSDEKSSADQYAAYVDPETLEDFLESAGLELNAENSLFFLMTFPFYEHEWDIFGFLLDCVFGADDESDDFEDMGDDSSADDNDSEQ